jgi:hypothetical protein
MQRTAVGSTGTSQKINECDAQQLSVVCCMLNRVIILPASAKRAISSDVSLASPSPSTIPLINVAMHPATAALSEYEKLLSKK